MEKTEDSCKDWPGPERAHMVRDVNYKKDNEPERTGEAYALFNCPNSKAEIETELTKVCNDTRIPSKLELVLIECQTGLLKDKDAIRVLEAKKCSLSKFPKNPTEVTTVSYQYLIHGKLPGITNSTTADELKNVMNLLSSKQLYPQDKAFSGEIIYERRKKFWRVE